jgi:hypothetical protein
MNKSIKNVDVVSKEILEVLIKHEITYADLDYVFECAKEKAHSNVVQHQD